MHLASTSPAHDDFFTLSVYKCVAVFIHSTSETVFNSQIDVYL